MVQIVTFYSISNVFCTMHTMMQTVNLLALKGDQHLISPYNITPESNSKVTRIEETITNQISSRLLTKFSSSGSEEMSREQCREYECLC